MFVATALSTVESRSLPARSQRVPCLFLQTNDGKESGKRMRPFMPRTGLY